MSFCKVDIKKSLEAQVKSDLLSTGKFKEVAPEDVYLSYSEPSLYRVSKDFNERLETLLKEAHRGNVISETLELGRPRRILHEAGLPDYPIQLSFVHLYKNILGKHGHKMNAYDLFDLPRAINNPLMILEGKSENGEEKLWIMTKLKSSKNGKWTGKAIDIIIEAKRRGQAYNAVNTFFPRDNFHELEEFVSRDYMKFVNKEKALTYYQSLLQQASLTATYIPADTQAKIRTIIEKIKKFNNKISDEEVFQLQSFEEQADAKLDERMKAFLKPFGITVEALDTLKERVGVDALGAADILNKLILINKGKAKLDTLPEETAHFFVELMGNQHPTVKALMGRITEWEGYKAVYEEYKDVYDGNEVKIKKEAIGKLIAKYIVKHKDVPKSFLQQIKDLINEVLRMFDMRNIPATEIAEDVAVDILMNNYSKLKRKLPSGARLVEYDKTMRENRLVQHVADRIRGLGFYLTGSLALRKQGTVYRAADENVHDLDFKVPEHLKDNWREVVEKEFGGQPLSTAYEFIRHDEKIIALNINGIVVDFFVQEKVELPATGNFSRWQDIFTAKLGLGSTKFGREKDLIDFITFQPYQRSQGFEDKAGVYLQMDSKDAQQEVDKINDAYKEEIAEVDGNIVEIEPSEQLVDLYWEANKPEPPATVEEALKHKDKISNDIFRDMFESHTEETLKYIADQVFSRTATGAMSDVGSAESSAIRAFGEELVSIAKRMFPLEKQATAEGLPSIIPVCK